MDKMEQARVRAVRMCKDPGFYRWLERRLDFVPGRIGDATTCADFLRLHLKIVSRSQIASDEEAYRRFLALEAEFKQSVGQLAEARG
jgi:hypothetical protein